MSVTPIQDKTKKSIYGTYNKELPPVSPTGNDVFDDLSNIDYTSASQSQGSNSHFMNIMGVGQLINAEKTKIESYDDKLPPSPSCWTIKTPGSTIPQNPRIRRGHFSGAKKRGFGF
jgi:hypothetical protein